MLLAAVLLLVYGVTLRAPAMGLYHDDGIYVITAKALAEGHGYRILSLPDEIPQTKYPILFPLALAAIWKIAPSFPENVFYLKLLPFAAALVWLWLVDRLLAQQTGRPKLARGIVLLTAASPSVVFFSTILLAETLFAALAWGGLWMLARCERESATGSRLLWASLLCGAAFHTRTLGFTLIAAGIASLIMKRKLRAALVFGALSGALALPWLLWTSKHMGTIPEFYSYYTSIPYKEWNVLFGFTLPEKLTIVVGNAFFLLPEPARLIGFHSQVLWPLRAMIVGLILIGFVASVRKSIGVVHVFLALYLATLLLWAWPPARFLLPVYPLLLLYAAHGGMQVLDRVARPRIRMAVIVAAVVLVAFVAGWGSGTVGRQALTKGRGCVGMPCERSWEDFLSLMSWLAVNTPPGGILMGTEDPMLYLYTGRKAVRAFDPDPALLYFATDPKWGPFGPPKRLVERMAESRAGYLVLTRRAELLEDTFLWRQVRGLTRERPDLLELEMIVGSPDFGVYRVDLGQSARR